MLGRGDVNAWISLSVLLVILSYALFRYLISAPDRRWEKFLVLSLSLFDLGAFDWSAANRIQEGTKGTDYLERLQNSRGVANFLRSRPGMFRVQILADLPPNIGDLFDVETIMGNGVTIQQNLRNRSRCHRTTIESRRELAGIQPLDLGTSLASVFPIPRNR